MSGTGYTDPRYVKTAVCSKCEGLKTWNYWYHHDDTLCSDCYYSGAKYYNLTKEEAMYYEREGIDPNPPRDRGAELQSIIDKSKVRSVAEISEAVLLLNDVIADLTELVEKEGKKAEFTHLLEKKKVYRDSLLWVLHLDNKDRGY